MTIGRRIAEARRAAGYDTQADLAEALGVAQTTVSDVENDRYDDIGVRRLMRFASKVKVPIEHLVAGLDADYDKMRRDLVRQGANINQKPSMEGGSPDVDEAAAVLLEALRAEHSEFRSRIEAQVRALLDAVRDDGRREAASHQPREAAAGEGNH